MGKQAAYSSVLPGQRFTHDGNTWEKRGDIYGSQLIDRHGSISFMCGSRCFEQFQDSDLVTVL